ncbi:PREDICTED: MAGUK p55 subfamily member 5 isoform X2 [Nicrophorus vespilloides]|uniref:MAGUK p55 subfamily member 5 isoform X2 n=1 Tax=Nicrophorus vespilloides TaxID=110193 RepID=A0ABM1NAR3_NICVS|nr:PREDICTED: MAGUK p55 subfamily member 5 isoform X2 [Nicrophorus vespilloides]
MVDLGGYVIILVETKDKKIKLYGSPADKDNLEVGDEILEVNGKTLEDASHTEVISHIHQCIRSRTICLRVKRRSGARLAVDLDLCSSNVQDAFVIAVEQQARERLERLSALKRITPVDMTKLSQQLNQQSTSSEELNGFINSSPIYVTSLTATENLNNNSTGSKQGVGGEAGGGCSTTTTVSAAPAGPIQPALAKAKQPSPTAILVPANQTNGHHHHNQHHHDQSDLILTQQFTEAEKVPSEVLPNTADQVLDVRKLGDRRASLGDRRASSPFQNGRTELLIGAEDNKLKTTAIIENNNNNNKLVIEPEIRTRRRSGSSIVVLDGDLDPVKIRSDLDDSGINMVMMLAGDNGPHREMAVDVPDSFIARNKTPPRYPPPKPILAVGYDRLLGVTFGDENQERAIDVPDNFVERKKTPPKYPISTNVLKAGVNGSTTQTAGVVNSSKPVPPPRDHLKMEKDGRLVNSAQAPQLPTRITNNNNIQQPMTPVSPTSAPADPNAGVANNIKKYQEQIRKRKEEEDRIAAQNDFLNRSLRGSRKLQALESYPSYVNEALVDDEGHESSRPTTPVEKEIVHTPYGYGDLVASVQRLQLQLKKAGTGGGLGGMEGRVAAVQSLLLSPQFGRALAIYNKVQAVRNRTAPRPTANAQAALRDCLDALSSSQSTHAVELAALLTGYEFEALMIAHDGVASTLPEDSTTPMPSPSSSEPILTKPILPEQYRVDNIKVIKIEKSTEPLGATVRNEADAVVVGRVVRGGAADKSGLLHEGDEILEVNGIEMRGKSVNTVCDILAAMEGTLTFLIVPASQARAHSSRESMLHVRAHFDYDPEEDMYIPCRELGIGFQKGDVLHIISQEDPNWWQAYREGEEDQTLAGLVPSQSFQHQRESMRLAAEERMSKPQRKSTTLLCGKATKRKKKKGAYADAGYPITNTADEFEAEEILTYEEVSTHYPRANNKRPIVLIGPPNIGRHELRQKLMEDSDRFAAAIPHTSRARKDSEVDSQDYHFITRAQFEADILSRKFVEHGEYEKAYYGTSLDAIRSVVNSGKICVLNLHPQSLKILRTSDLKPYIVFVAPPSLEKLRQKKLRSGETYKEEDLKNIIEKAREMEEKYGHFFDMIIINNDTERAYGQLLTEINSLEREPQWVPAAWVKAT